MGWSLVAIALAMAITDILGTSLVIAEARGRSWLAGSLDALSDISRLLYTALGVHALDQWDTSSGITLFVVCCTSFVATTTTTKIVHRITNDKTTADTAVHRR
jgi:hypothetical protein